MYFPLRFFVIMVAYLYSVLGTLNMADISQRITEVNQPGIISVIAIGFLIVVRFEGCHFPASFPMAAWFLLCSAHSSDGSIRGIADKGRDLFHFPDLYTDVLS